MGHILVSCEKISTKGFNGGIDSYWCLESPKNLLNLKSLGKTQGGHALFKCYRENFNLAQEDRSGFFDTPKCAQLPHLYMTYEATYRLKRFVFEKIAKNHFLTYANSVILRNS